MYFSFRKPSKSLKFPSKTQFFSLLSDNESSFCLFCLWRDKMMAGQYRNVKAPTTQRITVFWDRFHKSFVWLSEFCVFSVSYLHDITHRVETELIKSEYSVLCFDDETAWPLALTATHLQMWMRYQKRKIHTLYPWTAVFLRTLLAQVIGGFVTSWNTYF